MEKNTNELRLELGDIIRVHAPVNKNLHERSFYVSYLDEFQHTTWVDIETSKAFTLEMDNGFFDSSASIEQIVLLSRSAEKGFARQNGLVLGKWIDMHFGGDIPMVLTACVTDLEEDMVEFTTYTPSGERADKLYIDFAYKGIPEQYPITDICLRDAPLALQNTEGEQDKDELDGVDELDDIDNRPYLEYNEDGTLDIYVSEEVHVDERYQDELYNLQQDANAAIYQNEAAEEDAHDSLDSTSTGSSVSVQNMALLPKHLRVYKIDAQINNLYDDFLSRIPEHERSYRIMQQIYTHIQRFQELRESYSVRNSFEQIIGRRPPTNPQTHRPILEHILRNHTNIPWVYPVVSHRKTLFNAAYENIQTSDTDIFRLKPTLLNETASRNNLFYENTYRDSDYVQYEHMNQSNLSYLTPFEPYINEMFPSMYVPIKHDMDVIVANLDGFESSVVNEFIKDEKDKIGLVHQKPFVVQRYNTSSTYGAQINKREYENRILFPADHMQLHSLLFMPEQALRQSRMHLPQSTVLERADLSHFSIHPYKAFSLQSKRVKMFHGDETNPLFPQNNTILAVNLFPTENRDNPFQLEPQYEQALDEQGREYILQNTLKRLTNAFPNAFSLVDHYAKLNQHIYSMGDFIKLLEPYMIYSDQGITTGIVGKIRYYVNRFRNHYTLKYRERQREYQRLEQSNFTTKRFTIDHVLSNKGIFSMIDNDIEMQGIISGIYGQSLKLPSEILHELYVQDDGTLITQMLKQIDVALTNSEDFFQEINIPGATTDADGDTELADADESIFLKPTDCYRKTLVKDYDSLRDMELDNMKTDVEYDTHYDVTNYNILQKYSSERDKKSKSDFFQFLAEQLVKKHKCPTRLSKEYAETLIRGKKYVQDGEYARLITVPKLPNHIEESSLNSQQQQEIDIERNARKRESFYIRRGNVWVHDKSVNENSFLDTNTIFCNIQDKCYRKEEGNGATCEDIELDVKTRMLREEKAHMNDELLSRYERNIDQLKEENQFAMESLQERILKAKEIYRLRMHAPNTRGYNMGKTIYHTDKLLSPHWAQRHHLFHHSLNMDQRQMGIIEFYRLYCREPISDTEEAGWKYCFETSAKLLETSLYELAIAYVEGSYMKKMDYLIKRIGTLSDDGSRVIDKNTGCELRKIEASEDGDFFQSFGQYIDDDDDEGRKTEGAFDDERALREMEVSMRLKKVKKRQSNQVMYDDPILQGCFEVIAGLCEKAYVPIESVETVAMRICTVTTKNKHAFPTENAYKKLQEKMKAQSKKIASYATHIETRKIDCAAGAFLIAVQTLMPSFFINKYEKNCRPSFTGYPLDGTSGGQKGIAYVACILKLMIKNSKVVPTKGEELDTRIYTMIEKYLMPLEYVQKLLIEKTDYAKEHETQDDIPTALTTRVRWERFAPPTRDVKIIDGKPLSFISPDFHKNLEEEFKRGNASQWGALSVYTSKVELFTYGLVELLENILQKKETLLNTFSQIPFQQNACCNDSTEKITTLQYFAREDDNIAIYVKSTSVASRLLRKFKQDLKTSFLRENKRNIAIKSSTTESNVDISKKSNSLSLNQYYKTIDKDMMYKIYFHYCKYDSETYVLPEDLRDVCTERPNEYDPHASLEQKIDMMTELGKSVTATKFSHMMTSVNRRNTITINPPIEIHWKSLFISELEQFRENMTNGETTLLFTIDDVIDAFSQILDDDNVFAQNGKETDESHDKSDSADDDADDNNESPSNRTSNSSNNSQTAKETHLNNRLYIHITNWKKELEFFLRDNLQDSSTRQITTIIQQFMKAYFENEHVSPATMHHHMITLLRHYGIIFPLRIGTNYRNYSKEITAAHHTPHELTDGDRTEYSNFLHWCYGGFDQMQDPERHYSQLLYQVLSTVHEKLEPIMRILPYLSSIIVDDDEHKSLRSRIYLFFTLLIFKTYLDLSQNTQVIQRTVALTQKNQFEYDNMMGNIDNTTPNIDSLDNVIEDMHEDLLYESRRNLQTEVASLLKLYLQYAAGPDRDILYNSYDHVLSIVERAGEIEKNKVKKHFLRLQQQGPEHLRAEMLLKRMRLGKYNINVKDLATYGKTLPDVFTDAGEPTTSDPEAVTRELMEGEQLQTAEELFMDDSSPYPTEQMPNELPEDHPDYDPFYASMNYGDDEDDDMFGMIQQEPRGEDDDAADIAAFYQS